MLLEAMSLEMDAGYLVLASAMLSWVNHDARHSTVTKIRAKPEARDHDKGAICWGTLDQHLQSCWVSGLRAIQRVISSYF